MASVSSLVFLVFVYVLSVVVGTFGCQLRAYTGECNVLFEEGIDIHSIPVLRDNDTGPCPLDPTEVIGFAGWDNSSFAYMVRGQGLLLSREEAIPILCTGQDINREIVILHHRRNRVRVINGEYTLVDSEGKTIPIRPDDEDELINSYDVRLPSEEDEPINPTFMNFVLFMSGLSLVVFGLVKVCEFALQHLTAWNRAHPD